MSVISYMMIVLSCSPGEHIEWQNVECKGPVPLPRSLHSAVMLKNKMFVFGGWVPVFGEDGRHPIHETEWKCSNSLACLNTGEKMGLYRVWVEVCNALTWCVIVLHNSVHNEGVC